MNENCVCNRHNLCTSQTTQPFYTLGQKMENYICLGICFTFGGVKATGDTKEPASKGVS